MYLSIIIELIENKIKVYICIYSLNTIKIITLIDNNYLLTTESK